MPWTSTSPIKLYSISYNRTIQSLFHSILLSNMLDSKNLPMSDQQTSSSFKDWWPSTIKESEICLHTKFSSTAMVLLWILRWHQTMPQIEKRYCRKRTFCNKCALTVQQICEKCLQRLHFTHSRLCRYNNSWV
jgi:hypothetical protein